MAAPNPNAAVMWGAAAVGLAIGIAVAVTADGDEKPDATPIETPEDISQRLPRPASPAP